MGIIEEHIKLTKGIASGSINQSLVLKEIDRIEREYGEDAFGAYRVQRKSAPWTKADLDELEIQSASGACSKDFYIYMAEVSDYVHKDVKERGISGFITKFGQTIARHWLIALIAIGILVMVIFIFAMNR